MATFFITTTISAPPIPYFSCSLRIGNMYARCCRNCFLRYWFLLRIRLYILVGRGKPMPKKLSNFVFTQEPDCTDAAMCLSGPAGNESIAVTGEVGQEAWSQRCAASPPHSHVCGHWEVTCGERAEKGTLGDTNSWGRWGLRHPCFHSERQLSR